MQATTTLHSFESRELFLCQCWDQDKVKTSESALSELVKNKAGVGVDSNLHHIYRCFVFFTFNTAEKTHESSERRSIHIFISSGRQKALCSSTSSTLHAGRNKNHNLTTGRRFKQALSFSFLSYWFDLWTTFLFALRYLLRISWLHQIPAMAFSPMFCIFARVREKGPFVSPKKLFPLHQSSISICTCEVQI